jgi:ATP-dependent Clp protease protease subunit
MDVYSHLLSERIVYLGTEVDDGVSNALIAQLIHLEAVNTDRDIMLYINSPGGSLTAVFAVYDAMQFIRAPIATFCVGQACSSAALLLMAGDPGKRTILPHARVVLQQPSGRSQGAIPDLILQADEVIRLRSESEAIMSRHTGKSIDELRKDMDRDRVFSAAAAVEYGIADQVLGNR